MNDIVWHILDDENEELIRQHRDNLCLIETDITFRIDRAQYIQNGRLTTANEDVKRFAFFE